MSKIRVMTEAWLEHPTSAARRSDLDRARRSGQVLRLELARDLLCLDLDAAERQAILKACDRSDLDRFADFLTADLGSWDPNLAATALREWQRFAGGRHAARLQILAGRKNLPLRLTLALAEVSWEAGGRRIVAPLVAQDDLAELGDAALSLLFLRATQFRVRDDGLSHLAERKLVQALEAGFGGATPTLPFALGLLLQQDPTNVEAALTTPFGSGVMASTVHAYAQGAKGAELCARELEAFFAEPPKAHQDFYLQLVRLWPALPYRSGVTSALLRRTFAALAERPAPGSLMPPPCAPVTWEWFAGIDVKVLREGVGSDAKALAAVGSLLDGEATVKISAAQAPPVFDARSAFFAREYRGETAFAHKTRDASPWSVLLAAAAEPATIAIDHLAAAHAALPAMLQRCTYKVIERCKGRAEAAALAALGARSIDVSTAAEAVSALAAIGGLAATTLLVATSCDQNVSLRIRVQAAEATAGMPILPQHQETLRVALRQLTTRAKPLSSEESDLAEAWRALVGPVANDSAKELPSSPELARRIPRLSELSPAVGRSLHTAHMILEALKANRNDRGLDVSSPVDLQYKALEILFRERFARSTTELVASGILQRKLDRIGYTRAARETTDQFESYIATLPVVRDIPGFSRHKFSKTMKAIAMFREGRHFSLDGVKAYAMFFLAFGRKSCTFGLAELYPTGLANDETLLDFVRNLHVFQDIRNRAVHEGLPIGALAEVDALWGMSAALLSQGLDFRRLEEGSG